MPIKKSILLFLFLVINLFASFSVSPSVGYQYDTFKFTLSGPTDRNDYNFYLNFNRTDDNTQWLSLTDGGGKVKMDCSISSNNNDYYYNCSKALSISGIGDRKARIAVYKNSEFLGFSNNYVSFIVKKANEAPRHIQTYIYPKTPDNYKSFTIYSSWSDKEDDYIVNVRARYRLKGSSSYKTVYLGYSGSNRDTKNFSYTFKNGLSSGEYELEITAEDKENLNDSVLHNGSWIRVGTFKVNYNSFNTPPQANNVSGTIDKNGDLKVTFNPYDKESSAMGADVYLSYANNTNSYQYKSKKTIYPTNFTGTSQKSVTYTHNELTNLGITNGKQFKIRVNIYDDKQAEGKGYSSTIKYSYTPSSLLPSLSLYKDIDFGKSKTRSLNVTNLATIELDVKNATEVQVNFDGIGSYEVSKNISSNGVYKFSYLFKKSDYPKSDNPNFWMKNLVFTATAYNKNGASNVIKSQKFTIYDLQEYNDYLKKLEIERQLEERKRKEEEQARLNAQKEEIKKQQQQLDEDIDNITKDYSNNVEEEYNDKLSIFDNIPKNCAWLESDGTCINPININNQNTLASSYSFQRNIKDGNYDYTIQVIYKNDNQDNYFPAVVKLVSNVNDVENYYISEEKVVENVKQLYLTSNILVEEYKNYIDKEKTRKAESLENEQYILNLHQDNILTKDTSDSETAEEKKSRIANAVSKSWESYKDEIYNTALKVSGNIDLVFNEDTSGVDKAKYVTRSIYQISLGTLKAVFNLGSDFVYGLAEDEINDVMSDIKDLTQEQFNKLDQARQEEILAKIDKAIETINSNPELSASTELALLQLNKLAKGLKDVNKVTKSEILKVGKNQVVKNITNKYKIVRIKSIQKFKSLLNAGKLRKFKGVLVKTPENLVNLCSLSPRISFRQLAKSVSDCIIVPTYRGFISKSKILMMDAFELVSDSYKILLDKLAKGDPTGKIVESIVKKFFELNFEKYKLYNGMYSGNKGFDMVYIKGPIDKIEQIIIVEAKQITKNGSSKLTYNKRIEVTQLTDEWLKLTAQQLYKLGGNEAKIAKFIENNLGNSKKISKIFATVDKNLNSVNYQKIIMGEIEF